VPKENGREEAESEAVGLPAFAAAPRRSGAPSFAVGVAARGARAGARAEGFGRGFSLQALLQVSSIRLMTLLGFSSGSVAFGSACRGLALTSFFSAVHIVLEFQNGSKCAALEVEDVPPSSIMSFVPFGFLECRRIPPRGTAQS